MTTKPLLVSGLALLLWTGCGSEVEPFDGNGGGGQGASGGSGASGGAGGAGGGTGGGVECHDFADQTAPVGVTLRFRNESGQTIFIPGGCTSAIYNLSPTGVDDGTSYVWEPSCLQTCEDLWTDSGYDCGACAPLAFELEHGETLDVPWNGTGLRSTDMPAACFHDPGQSQCSQIVAARQGEYRASAYGFADCEGDGDTGTCSCGPDGQCFGYPAGAQAYSDQAKFVLGQDSIVEVLFGVCAFPCP